MDPQPTDPLALAAAAAGPDTRVSLLDRGVYDSLTREERRAFRDLLAGWLFRAATDDGELEELRPE